RQTYRSPLMIGQQGLPSQFNGARAACTAIYFLLQSDEFSAFHRLKADEIWHFYAGGPLTVHLIDPEGRHRAMVLGGNFDQGESFQALGKAGCWFGSQPRDGKNFALVGCTVAPGFEFEDFELARRDELIRRYPQHRALIEQLTRSQ